MSDQRESLTYRESVKINLGDYESREVSLSYTTLIDEEEEFDNAYKRAKNLVKKKMFIQEKKMRSLARDDVDFDTMARL